ncbi:phosphonatase-like hydrolase [Quadrisphaera oryzae]|uniref:phosphonatase-like hydrolase n=1 Tax=Quadrisphaera TaxID=317661 RepID=UPI001647EA65|nr:phosphonatase-like hydrolase [Quadrisphaera sp. RL12-1S]MBC3760559.1 phosphonatase-like hydrolase [Quadrisphaera sp. RL12-1S]
MSPWSTQLVALDVAGTTVEEHSAVYAALREAVEAAGAPVADADLAGWMGADKREAVAALLAAGGVPAGGALVEEVLEDFRARLAAAYAARPPHPFPGVPQALARLRERGVKVALTTGFDRGVTAGLLDQLGWAVGGEGEGRLDAVVCVDDVPAGRPAPWMVFRAMEATGTTAVADVLVAGDTPRDLRAGTNAGAGAVVGVLTGGVPREVLAAEPHTHLLGSVAELPQLLGLA